MYGCPHDSWLLFSWIRRARGRMYAFTDERAGPVAELAPMGRRIGSAKRDRTYMVERTAVSAFGEGLIWACIP